MTEYVLLGPPILFYKTLNMSLQYNEMLYFLQVVHGVEKRDLELNEDSG